MKQLRKQSGVALITAILMVALATLIATKLSWDSQVSIRRTEMTLAQEQARMFALGAEAAAIDLIRQDDDAEVDLQSHFDEINQAPALEIGIGDLVMGQMLIRLYDAQRKLNVNDLMPDENGEINPLVRAQFQRLFEELQLDPSLINGIADWIDPDTVPQVGGAEDGMYSALDTPYRAANTYMTSISELRAVNGIDPETYELLRNYLTAFQPDWCWNSDVISYINVNTAAPVVIASLSDELSVSQVEAMVEQRSDDDWQKVDDMPGLSPDVRTEIAPFIQVGTKCVELNVTVTVGSSVITMYSLLDRRDGDDAIRTRVRAFGLD
jgi:general secretion pathway protein K